MTLGPLARAFAIFSLSLAAIVLVMALRAVLEARAHAIAADVATDRADLEQTVVQLRSSARWYFPLNPYALRSLVRLEQMAERAESRGERERALGAYRAIHAALHAARGFYTPQAERLTRVDERIAALMAEQPAARMEGARSEAERKADYLALLSRPQPGLLGVLLALAGFVVWVGSAMVFLSWGVDAEGRVLRAVARRSVLCLLLGWIAFAVGLRIA